MITAILAIVIILIGLAAAAVANLLAYLLVRDRGKFWRPGDPLPDMPRRRHDPNLGRYRRNCPGL